MDHQSLRNVSRLTRNTLALILAGGKNPELLQLTRWRAEPDLHFGGKHRVIDFPLSNCLNSGVRRIGVLTQFGSHSLIRHLIKAWRFMNTSHGEFVEALPASQRTSDSWYLGTADAIYQNLDLIRMQQPEIVMVLAGDQVYKMDYGPLLAAHIRHQADLTVACIQVPRDQARGRYGVVTADNDGRVTSFAEKPEAPPGIAGQADQCLASMSLYVFNTGFLYEQLIRDADTPGSSHDFSRDILPNVLSRYRVFAYPFQNPISGEQPYWRDVGTVDSYWRANIELVDVSPELNLYDDEWPIRTHQRHLPPTKFVDIGEYQGIAFDSMVAGGCYVAGAYLKHSMLFSNVRVLSGSRVEDSLLLPEVEIGPNCRLKKAVVESGTRLPAGTIVGEDPVEDARRFHVTPQGVVLVTPDWQRRLD